jgi:hypothetical protein
MESACYNEMLMPVYLNARSVSQTTALFIGTDVRNPASLTFGLLCTGFACCYIRCYVQYCNIIDLYFLPNIERIVKSRRMRWVGHLARMGEERGVHRVLVGKPEGKRPLGRPRRR